MFRRTRKRLTDAVDLNLAAMLDMAFQLLAFFVLTYRPAPAETWVDLHLPPPTPILTKSDLRSVPPEARIVDGGLQTLTVNVDGSRPGNLRLSIGESPVDDLSSLDSRLKSIFRDPGMPFEQVVIRVSGMTRYRELMQVVEVFTHQKLANGAPLSKLSFVELP